MCAQIAGCSPTVLLLLSVFIQGYLLPRAHCLPSLLSFKSSSLGPEDNRCSILPCILQLQHEVPSSGENRLAHCWDGEQSGLRGVSVRENGAWRGCLSAWGSVEDLSLLWPPQETNLQSPEHRCTRVIKKIYHKTIMLTVNPYSLLHLIGKLQSL